MFMAILFSLSVALSFFKVVLGFEPKFPTFIFVFETRSFSVTNVSREGLNFLPFERTSPRMLELQDCASATTACSSLFKVLSMFTVRHAWGTGHVKCYDKKHLLGMQQQTTIANEEKKQ